MARTDQPLVPVCAHCGAPLEIKLVPASEAQKHKSEETR
jgi:hypothetical protein